MNRNTINIFFYEGWISVAPTIINISKILSKNNYNIEIISTKTIYEKYDPKDKNIKITLLNRIRKVNNKSISNNITSSKVNNSVLFKIIDLLKIRSIIPLLELIKFTIGILKLKRKKEGFNIAVDLNGSIPALLLYIFLGTKYLYLSLELPSDKKKIFKIRNYIFKLAYKFSKGVIVQDEDRLKSLIKYYSYNHPNIFYLPNSSFLPSSNKLKSGYLRDLLKIDIKNFQYILLYAGVLSNEMYSKEFAKSFSKIDKNFCLIYHERIRRSIDEPYIKEILELNNKNLFLSLNPVPYEEIENIFTSADIGLVLYKDIDNNYSQIAKASGKLAEFLKYGKPILVNNLKSLKDLVEKYNIGIVINDIDDHNEINKALDKIISNYEFYSKNAINCFKKEYDFEENFSSVLEYIKKNN